MSCRLPVLLLLPLAAGCAEPGKDPASDAEDGDTAPDDTGEPDSADPEETGSPTDTEETGEPPDTSETGEPPDTGDTTDTAEPAEPWPDSSLCLSPDLYGTCAGGIQAAGWSGGSYLWETNAVGNESEVSLDGAALFTVGTNGWHLPWGLAVAPDGDVFLAGSTLGPTQMKVGSSLVSLPHTYNRFVVKVSPAGEVRWSATIEGVSAERTLAAPAADGGVILVGEHFTWDVEVGGFVVPGSAFNEGTLVARLDPDGAWLWADKVPDSYYPAPSGEFRLGSISAGSGSDVEIHGAVYGELTVGADSLACSSGLGCPAYVTMTEEGSFLGLIAE